MPCVSGPGAQVATRTLAKEPGVRDYGLLESALARYHALIDGNNRLALFATITFDDMNGIRLTVANDEAHDPTIDVASGRLDDTSPIASVLQSSTEPRRPM